MKSDLEELVNETEGLEKKFHPKSISNTYDGSKVLYIYDIPEFIEWITKVKYELTDIYSRTNDTFVFELICATGIVNYFDGKHHSEQRMFIQLKTALKQILTNASKYYPIEIEAANTDSSRIYMEFFTQMLSTADVNSFINSHYSEESEYSNSDLNEILGYLKEENLISGYYADNRFNLTGITFKGKHFFDVSQQSKKKDENMNLIDNTVKHPKIFISHSSKDKKYVELLVELLESIGLNHEHIFCTSMPGYDIPVGTNIFECLRNQFLKYDLHVIFIHSDNYYESAVSLNEMGAAWALKNNHTSILLPGFDFSKMRGVINSKEIGIKLDNDEYEVKDKLNQLQKTLVQEFHLPEPHSTKWERYRDVFIKSVNTNS